MSGRGGNSSTALPPTRPTVGFTITTVALLWALSTVAATPLWPIYESSRLIVLVAVSLCAGSVIAIVGTYLRWSSFGVLGATIVAYFALGVGVAVPSATIFGFIPSLEGERTLLNATATAWKQLLTIQLPVGSYEALLVPAFLLLLCSTVIAVSIGLRARRGELGVIAPIVIFVVATLFGPLEPLTMKGSDGLSASLQSVLSSLALLAVTLSWLFWSRWYRRRQSIRRGFGLMQDGGVPSASAYSLRRSSAGFRTIASAILIMALAGAGAFAATNLLSPAAPRTVLRSAIVQPFDPRDYTSPLSSFRAYESTKQAEQTMLSVEGLPAAGRIRIATLDTYNGIVFTVGSPQVSSESGSFTRVPGIFAQSQTVGSPVSLSIQVDAYNGIWLPTIGKFESVLFISPPDGGLRDSFFYNDTSGSAVVLRQLARGDSYRLNAVEPKQPSFQELAGLRPGTAIVPPITTLPDQLSAVLGRWVQSASDPGSQLQAMIVALKANAHLSHGVLATDPPSRSGHSVDRLNQLLQDPRMIGDQEQFAVTAAIMARQIGFASRVVMGFAPATISQNGTTNIVGSDISAWIEVNTAEYGWVTVDPTPPAKILPAEEPTEPATATRPQSPVQPPAVLPGDRNDPVAADNIQSPPVPNDDGLKIIELALRVSGWSILAVAVALSPFLLIIITKSRRRRRRRSAPSALGKISGGWQEFEDAVRDHGYGPLVSPTRSEVAAIVGVPTARLLAGTADEAIFSAAEPAETTADSVWRLVEELRGGLSQQHTRRERLAALVSLKSLGWSFARRRPAAQQTGAGFLRSTKADS